MKKATMAQRIVVMMANSEVDKINAWQKVGFTEKEAKAMVKGSTRNNCKEQLGGVWRVGNVEWFQAISKEHAIKLFSWNFGYNNEPITFVK